MAPPTEDTVLDALLDPPDGDDDAPDSSGGHYVALSLHTVAPVDSEPAVEGCDAELTHSAHVAGIGALIGCSCSVVSVVDRVRKVA